MMFFKCLSRISNRFRDYLVGVIPFHVCTIYISILMMLLLFFNNQTIDENLAIAYSQLLSGREYQQQ
jgi:hypothetical protein